MFSWTVSNAVAICVYLFRIGSNGSLLLKCPIALHQWCIISHQIFRLQGTRKYLKPAEMEIACNCNSRCNKSMIELHSKTVKTIIMVKISFYINTHAFGRALWSWGKSTAKRAEHRTLYVYGGVGGVTVSMVAFQAVDPGSTPGRRTYVLT